MDFVPPITKHMQLTPANMCGMRETMKTLPSGRQLGGGDVLDFGVSLTDLSLDSLAL